MTKLFVLGAVGVAAGAFAAIRAKQRTASRTRPIDAFDLSDLDDPVVVAEEVVIVTEAGPYEIDMELVPGDDRAR